MKQLITLLLFTLLTISCTTPKYKEGDVLCTQEIEITVFKVHNFVGTGFCNGSNYTCKYKTTLGEIITDNFCESELTKCK